MGHEMGLWVDFSKDKIKLFIPPEESQRQGKTFILCLQCNRSIPLLILDIFSERSDIDINLVKRRPDWQSWQWSISLAEERSMFGDTEIFTWHIFISRQMKIFWSTLKATHLLISLSIISDIFLCRQAHDLRGYLFVNKCCVELSVNILGLQVKYFHPSCAELSSVSQLM